MTDQIDALRIFTRVARAGNFSRVAQELNLSRPTEPPLRRRSADLVGWLPSRPAPPWLLTLV